MSTPVVFSGSLTLQAQPASAGAARHFVSQALRAAGRTSWTAPAELAVSELVTNAVLHAHTPIELAVRITADAATVRVRDWSKQLPVARHWGATATTGRGLALVAATTSEHGMDVLAEGGKVIWFRVDDRAPAGREQAIRSEWDLDSVLAQFPDLLDSRPQPVPVVLQAVPVLLWLASQQQYEAVLRELFLCPLETLTEATTGSVALVEAGRALAVLSAAVDQAVREFGAPGSREVDIALAVSIEDRSEFAALQDALDLGFRLASSGRLLQRPSLPEVVALRDWACGQILAQAQGVPGSPWIGVDQPRFTDSGPPGTAPPTAAWDDRVIRATELAVVAADDSNRIIGVSPAAGQLLGWPPSELTGRRIITIVPPRLREAHIAGFTRFLTTGRSRLLGVEVELPALRSDGAETLIRFRLEHVAGNRIGPVYLAWLTPVPAEEAGSAAREP